jgi:hypothetical protein
MEKSSVASFGLRVRGKEPLLVGAVPASSQQAMIRADVVSATLAGVGTMANDSRVEELECDDRLLVMLDCEDMVVALDPSEWPFTQWCVEAKFWVPTDPVLHNISPRLLPRTTCPIRAESGDVRNDETGLRKGVGCVSVCASLSMPAWRQRMTA